LESAGLITRRRRDDERQVNIDLSPREQGLRQEALIPPAIIAQLGIAMPEFESLHAALTKVMAAARRSGADEI
jgi:DNA-binding MarR family transcriptional regulator